MEHRDYYMWLCFHVFKKNLTLPVVGIIIIIGITTTIVITTDGTWKALQLSDLYALEGCTSVL